MAQVQCATNTGYAEMAKQCTYGESATAIRSAICLKTACCALEACSAADITNCTESGLTVADATMTTSQTTVANDTMQLDHQFNCQANATVKGFACFNDDNDVMEGICCFAADVPLVVNDLINVQFKWAIAA